ncbi:signal peptide peptidase SppA [Nannocystis radixulma]|uniref:Signal peptide peptidase SppA n=1 Tax=Nannocystis radixulma TaxID=2995305 RepID=A0ABT5AZL0_9BACT|nr:signal peptide peptidase SppA [Nannocystis radixulma]MDC0667276.1 signal peptide peptidase SppA [Nannocystis radixulma]
MAARSRSPRTSLVCALLFAGLVTPAHAAPPEPAPFGAGEGRSLLRDIDMPQSHVAGEADAAAVAVNPAAMGFLRGFSGVLAGNYTRAASQRRGGGFGVFVAVPLTLKLFGQKLAENFLSLGAGYQRLCPFGCGRLPSQDFVEWYRDDWVPADLDYNKLTLAAAVPLMRWAPGLSLGISYARMWSEHNLYAQRLHQAELSLAYRPSRYVALGLVARAINSPRAGQDLRIPEPPRPGILDRRQPFELDAEVAVRPIKGSRSLELGVGARVVPMPNNDPRFHTPVVAPRGRIAAGGKGWRLFGEVERYYVNTIAQFGAADALRAMVGLELDFTHVGVAAGPVLGPSGPDGFGAQGGAFKIRASAERYTTLAQPPLEALRFDVDKYAGDRGAGRLVDALDRYSELRRDRAVVALEVDGSGNGWGEIEEIREAMLRVRARGGKVAVYLRGAGLKDYFLAAAADRVILHPGARLSIVGMRSEIFYYAELLGRLGAKAEFVRAYEYKSRPEQWERTGPTPESDAQRRLLLTDIWNHVVRMVAQGRQTTPEKVVQWIDTAPHTAEQALRGGMIDAVGYADELEGELEKWLTRKVNLRAPSSLPVHDQSFGPGPVIAVVHVEGTISDGESLTVPLVGSVLAGGRTLVRAIDRLREDRRVKAVVVRIDSPGGSVAASDDMARALDRIAKIKPVVISFGDVAASGGYYVATAGSYIFADATTKTGSIGVFRPKVDVSGVLTKFGVHVESIDYGAHAGLYTWFKPYTPEERAAAQAGVDASYQEFIARVAKARKMTIEQVDAVARGRVWSGVRARELGLVDAYGGLREAVAHAREQAKLKPGEGDVRHVPAPPSLGDQISAIFGLKLPSPLGLGESAMVWVLRRLPPSLWLSERPADLALAEETIVVE